MRKTRRGVLPLICALMSCGCASSGPVVKPVACPALPPVPPSLMTPPDYESRVRRELFEQQPNAMPTSPDFSPR